MVTFEFFKVKMNVAPKLIDEVLKKCSSVYSFRWNFEFDLENKETVRDGI